jgi:redox-sensing transcriptional repressor
MATPRIRLRKLSEPTIGRLPIYQRIVETYEHRGIDRIESSQIASLTGVTATTVRRDLAGLGQLGTRGSGYDVRTLIEKIGEALGHDRSYSVVVVGMGNLGHALVNSSNFLIRGASLAAIYDAAPEVIGTEVAGHRVRSIDEPMLEATVGVICTPAAAAQSVADAMVKANVRAILNFAPAVINVPIGVAVHYVDFSIELQILVFHLLNTVNFAGGVIHSLGITASKQNPQSS